MNREEDDHHACCHPEGECHDRGGEDDRDALHPLARSTSSTVKGAFPGGVTSNESPQCPTMISAGATCATALPELASALAGGGRLDSTAAATIADPTRSTSPATRRRRSAAAPGPRSGRSRAASSRGLVLSKFTAASSSAVASRPIFTRIA